MVYIVQRVQHYGASDILGVFESFEDAQAEARAEAARQGWSFDQAEEWVGGRLWVAEGINDDLAIDRETLVRKGMR